MMDYNTLIKALKAKEYKPIYFLQGEEAYFIDEIAKEIEQNALEEHEKDFNQNYFFTAKILRPMPLWMRPNAIR